MFNTNLISDFTASVVQDLNAPTMAINSFLNNVSNPPNGYQTGGKVVSVIDSKGELGAQLSLTRGYSNPQYRYKDNNGWSTWQNILLVSDFRNSVIGGITNVNNQLRLQVEQYNDNALYLVAYNNDTNTRLGAIQLG